MLKKTIIVSTFLALLSGCQTMPQQKIDAQTLMGSWKIVSILGDKTAPYSPAEITFSADGKLSGNNSCNNFFGSYHLQGDKLTLNLGGSTMKACVDALMSQEQLVSQAMPQVDTVKLTGDQLQLNKQNGKTLFTLERVQP